MQKHILLRQTPLLVKHPSSKWIALLYSCTLSAVAAAQAPVIQQLRAVAPTVALYDKYEVAVTLTATYANPYDYDQIAVRATFTAPSGRTQTVDGFYQEEFQLADVQTGRLQPLGTGQFAVRFAPTEQGTWRYTVSCETPQGRTTSETQSFVCTPATHSSQRGFVRLGKGNYLKTDNGDNFIPIGLNMAWTTDNPLVGFQRQLTGLAAKGGNYFRLWLCHWGLGLEWQGSGYAGLGRYRQDHAWYLDWLFDFCATRGLYVQWCLQHHGQVSTTVNPAWADNPYNAQRGGPCARTADFFTHTQARRLTRNGYRYLLARWGYARSIAAWELFNEVDWTDQFVETLPAIRDWHTEMSAFLKRHDPQQRLVTTSFAHEGHDAATWNLPDIDFTQTHHYVQTPYLERTLAASHQRYLRAYEKPTLTGEFGLASLPTVSIQDDPTGIHLHNTLWGSLFSGGLGAGLSWWWDAYIEQQNLYGHFTGLSRVAQTIDWGKSRFTPTNGVVQGALGDLTLVAAGGWGALTDTLVVIEANGLVRPTGATLGQYLYGSRWNTSLRRPPRFSITLNKAGYFQVRTGTTSGEKPILSIWVDGQLAKQEVALPQRTYEVWLTAGTHEVRIDNVGTDWISIADYTVPNVGALADAYVMRSDVADEVVGWVLHNRFQHDFVRKYGAPPALENTTLSVKDLKEGSYQVVFWDCQTGTIAGQTTATAHTDGLQLALPPFRWDVAFQAKRTAPVSTTMPTVEATWRVWPNPINANGTLHFSIEIPQGTPVQLYDAQGRLAGQFNVGNPLPNRVSAGVYWLDIHRSHTMIVVTNRP